MDPLEVYEDAVLMTGKSVFNKNQKERIPLTQLLKSNNAVLNAFANDNDLQGITVISTNFGFIKTYSKTYRRSDDERSS